MHLTAAEKAQLTQLIEHGAPLPAELCSRLFPQQPAAVCERLIDLARAGVFELAPAAGEVTRCNLTFAQLHGYDSPEECLAGLQQDQAGLDQEQLQVLLAQIKHTGVVRDFQAQLRKRDGSRAWGKLAARLNPDTGLVEGVVEDITAHVLAQAEVESLARFPGENPYPVLRIAGDGVLLYANASSRQLLAVWTTAVGQRLPETVTASVKAALESAAPQILEAACGERLYSLLLAPVNAEGYVNVYGREISALRQARVRCRPRRHSSAM